MATTAIAAKAAIRDIAGQSAGLAAFKTTWGFPTREPTKKWLMLGEIKWQNSDWATNKSRQETYRIGFSVNVQIMGGDGETCERAAAAAFAEFEDSIKANPQIGVPGIVYTNFHPQRLFSFPADDYYEGQFDGEIEIHARI